MNKKFFIKSVIIFTLFAFSFPVLAVGSRFIDNFGKKELNSDKWNIIVSGGNIIIKKGVLTLSVDGQAPFPYVESKYNPFPVEKNFVFTMRFRYPESKIHGSGLSTYSASGNSLFGVWHDSSHAINFMHGGNLGVFSIPWDNKFHIYKVVFQDGHYYYYLDGKLRFDAASNLIPTSIAMGHPYRVDTDWTSFAIDYVKINPLNSVLQ